MTVRVYAGHGSSGGGRTVMLSELERHDVDCAFIDEREIRNGDLWQKNTDALIFTARSAGDFKKALGVEGAEKIRTGILSGAFNYVGVCAGAALASAKIRYRMRDLPPSEENPPSHMPVHEKKIASEGLAFFNGLAIGPCSAVMKLPFHGGSEDLSLIFLRDAGTGESFNSFYWGGPALLPKEKIQNGHIGTFLQGTDIPMSVHLRYGEGHVHLMAYHPEIQPHNIWRWANEKAMSDLEVERLESLSTRLNHGGFERFLQSAGIPFQSPQIKMAALAATL